MESSLLCLVVPHKAGSEEREHWGGAGGRGCAREGEEEKERPRV